MAQHKSQLELQLPPIELNAERDTQLVKPSEETLRLGMQMKAVCEAFISDPTMTTEQYLNRIQALEDAQRQIEKRVIVVISQELPSVQDKVTATTIPEKK